MKKWVRRLATEALVLAPDHPEYLARCLRSCGNSKNLSEGKKVHASILRSKYADNTYLANQVVLMYGKCRSLEDARKVFDGIKHPDMFSHNIMILAYVQNGQLGEARSVFDGMQDRDSVTWNTMISAYIQNGHLEEAKSLFERTPHRTAVSWNTMITAYAQEGHEQEAKSMFDEMQHRDVISWNALISAYAQAGHMDEAKGWFEKMPQQTVVSWTTMILAFAQYGNLEEPKELFDRVPQRDSMAWNSMISAYAQKGYVEEADSMLKKMPQQDMVSWNATLAAHAQKGDVEKAKVVLESMAQRDVVSWTTMIQLYGETGDLHSSKGMFDSMLERDVVSWNAMVAAYAQNGHMEEAKRTFETMAHHDPVSWSVMIAAYAQNGHREEAKSMFEQMPTTTRIISSWNTMIASYAHDGCYEQAVELFRKMNLEGVAPDEITLTSILMACTHVGLLKEGRSYFLSFKSDHNVNHLREHYRCMIDLLGRMGQLKEAEELIEDMPFLPDIVAWGTLLGACRVHRDVKLGARVAEHAIELEPQNAAPYVLLANLYASVGKKDEVLMVRKKMKDRGVVKQPGISIIEVHNRVHRFIVGDTSHPRMKDIFAELSRLGGLMEEAGHRPDTREVLHDVCEEEKEKFLYYHSEKLAIAYGLISITNPGTPIRVVKNLRVCFDCHTATKLISKITQRRIVVRDATRFHHFEHGVCSCRDYW